MESDEFIVERMKVALAELDARHKELAADEENARRIARYEEVVAERDRLATELRSIYPDFAQRFRDLMTRVGRTDIEVAIVNRNLPRGKMPLADVETVARGGQKAENKTACRTTSWRDCALREGPRPEGR
jgi:hypothetical protein